MAQQIWITGLDCFVGANGLRPRFKLSDFQYNQNFTVQFWYEVGLTSNTDYVAGLTAGTLYPSAGASNTDLQYSVTYTSGEVNTYSKTVDRVPINTANFTTNLTANTSYTIKYHCKITFADGTTQQQYGGQEIMTTANNDVAITGEEGVANEDGSLSFSFSLTNSKNSIQVLHEQSISETVTGSDTSSTLSGGATTQVLPEEGTIRTESVSYEYAKMPVTSAKNANNFWRLKVKEKVNDTIVLIEPSNTTTHNTPNSRVYTDKEHMWFGDVFGNEVEVKGITTTTASITMSDHNTYVPNNNTFTIQLSTASNFSSPFDHTVAGAGGINVYVTENTTFPTDYAQQNVDRDGSYANPRAKYVKVTGLTSGTKYYYRIKFIHATTGAVSYSDEVKDFTTTAERYGVKTPSDWGVGFFFLGNFSAYKKLRIVDKPDFSPSWKSAVVINGIAYLGNVKYSDTDGTVQIKRDRILKSLPDAVDTFSKHNYIDAVSEDGDSITALSSLGDQLIEFKRNAVYVINVGGDYEILEQSIKGIGAENPSSVVQTPYGVAFVNLNGVYIFNGQKLINLLEREGKQLIKKSIWSDFVSVNSMIAYIQEKNSLLITDTAGTTSDGNCYIYDFNSQGWIYYKAGLPDNFKTNFIYDEAGRALFASGLGGTYYYPQLDDGGNNEFVWQSGEMYFDDASVEKKLYEMTVLYSNYGMDMQPIFKYSTDSGKNWNVAQQGRFRNHKDDNGWYKATFKPQSTSQSIYQYPTFGTLMIKIEAEGIVEGYTKFKLNQVDIEYRVLTKRITADDSATSTDTTGNTANYAIDGKFQQAPGQPSGL
tara:strand:- start:1399 stop:3861 length:2463 start_codon:yes stop_codon:yes gene_type:complete